MYYLFLYLNDIVKYKMDTSPQHYKHTRLCAQIKMQLITIQLRNAAFKSFNRPNLANNNVWKRSTQNGSRLNLDEILVFTAIVCAKNKNRRYNLIHDNLSGKDKHMRLIIEQYNLAIVE